jgi:lipoprotein-anchoring transpeptidase ErfK/SrfK
MKRGAVAVVLALLVVACGGAETFDVPTTTTSVSIPAPPAQSADLAVNSVEVDSRPVYEGFEGGLAEHTSLVAMAQGDVAVYSDPADPDSTLTVPWTTILGTVTVLTVVGEPADGWAKVMLPIRPNGSTGWVRVDDVNLYLVKGKIVIDLSDRQLTYTVDGEEVITSTIAIGTNQNQTPTGVFFVTDSVTLANPNSIWGPHALGLSARSDTIFEYNGGDGIIGIHGTRNDSSIGGAVSLGCVRMPNDLITELYNLVPLGTPVEIRA